MSGKNFAGGMNYDPNMNPNMPPQGPPPNYAEAVGGVYATAPMGFYPPTAPSMTKETVNVEPTIVTTVIPLGPNSTRTICPFCNAQISTATKSKPGVIAYVSSFLIALCGGFLCCCLIPCCMESCMDIEHTCPECKSYLGKFRRM